MADVIRKVITGGQINLTVLPNNVAGTTSIGGSLAQKAFSPTATVTDTDDGVIITIIDVDGEHTATVRHGEKGDKGDTGDAGVSPSVSLTSTDGGVILTVNDGTGPHTALIPRGVDGEPGVSPKIENGYWYLWDMENQVYVNTEVPIYHPLTYDAEPTDGSDNMLTSGTVKAALDTKLDAADVPTKVSDLDNDAGYLTEHQDISGKADIDDIPTKVSDLDNDAGYLTTHQDISGKADVEDIPTRVSQLENDSGYLTNHQDISGKADVEDIPTKVSQLQNDAGYLTQHQDISGKADTADIPTKVSQLQNDAGYLTQHQDISGKANVSDVPTRVSQLENDSGYLTTHQDISTKADKSEIPTKVSQLQNDSGYLTTHQDISGKADAADIPTKVSELQNDSGYLTQHQDISGKADTEDIPTKVSQLQNDAGYLTQHQDISGKQNVLTFDSAPTSGSTNPVTSGGVAEAIGGLNDEIADMGTYKTLTWSPGYYAYEGGSYVSQSEPATYHCTQKISGTYFDVNNFSNPEYFASGTDSFIIVWKNGVYNGFYQAGEWYYYTVANIRKQARREFDEYAIVLHNVDEYGDFRVYDFVRPPTSYENKPTEFVYDTSGVQSGYIGSDGTIYSASSSSQEVYTDLIPLSGITNIAISLDYSDSVSLWLAYAYYDENMVFISRTTPLSNDTSNHCGATFAPDTTYAFIRLSYRTYGQDCATVLIQKEPVLYDDYTEHALSMIGKSAWLKGQIIQAGYISETDSWQIGYAYRCGIIDIQHASESVTISAKSGYNVALHTRDSSGALINDSGWKTSLTIAAGTYYNLVFRKSSNAAVTPEEVRENIIVDDGDGLDMPLKDFVEQFYSERIVNDKEVDERITTLEETGDYAASITPSLINENVKAINHRGYTSGPENTLPAFKLSKQNGFLYVETDVRFTSDGVAVLLHDASINRTARNSDGTSISSTVNIADITYAEALTYDFGIYKGSAFAGTVIPTVEQFIAFCKKAGLRPYIEMRNDVAYTTAQYEAVFNIVRKYGMLSVTTWISHGTDKLNAILALDPNARVGLLADTLTTTIITTAQGLATSTNSVFVNCDYSTLTSEALSAMYESGLPLEVWTVNSESDLLALDGYISGVTSDSINAGATLYNSVM